MSNASNTDVPREGHRSSATEADVQLAQELVGDANELMGEEVLGDWPDDATVDRFLEGDRLERVLSLYGRAMRLDPDEPAYPWNLASSLNRLGLNDMALGYIMRAIRISKRIGDEEWSGADVHIAMADIAIGAGDHDFALTTLARAQELDDGSGRRDIERLLAELREASHDPHPESSLAGLLERLPA